MMEEKKEHILKCIWMLSGLVNYKLCDLNFECDICEFHKSMYKIFPDDISVNLSEEQFTISESEIKSDLNTADIDNRNKFLLHFFSGCKIHLNRFYHSNHLWSDCDSDNHLLLGLNSLTVKVLEPIDEIIMPDVARKYNKGEMLTGVVRKGRVIPFHSHIIGKVMEINPQIMEKSLMRIIYQDDYLFKMDTVGNPVNNNYDDSFIKGLQFFTKKVGTLIKYFNNAFRKGIFSDVGFAMADGGKMVNDLEKVIGKDEFEKLILDFFRI